jgi:uncharacterized protein
MQTALKWLPDDYDHGKASEFRKPIHMYILKIASLCNLDCSYCYVYQSPDKSWQKKPKHVSFKLLDSIAVRIQEHADEHDLDEVKIVFHGGEPLLAGLDRLKEYVKRLKSIISCQIDFGMQTNGILLNNSIIDFLFENQFQIGISLDGTRKHNDRHRLYSSQKSSYDKTVKAIELLQSKEDEGKIFGGILTVVDLSNKPVKILENFDELGIRSANLLLPDCNYESPPQRPENDDVAYGKWLYEFFDIWFENYSHIEVPYFEEIMNMMLGGISSSEEIGAKSVDFLVIDTNGDIEAVDTLKMVGREATSLNLNVKSNSISDALQHPAIYSRMSGYHSLCKTCRDCEFLNNCGGGYIPHRYSRKNGFINPSVYCEDLKYLFSKIKSRIFKVQKQFV